MNVRPLTAPRSPFFDVLQPEFTVVVAPGAVVVDPPLLAVDSGPAGVR